ERGLAPRLAGRYDQASLVNAMQTALKAAGRTVPGYLSLLDDELSPTRTETALFAMHCFWTGEVCLGDIDGVVGTRTGWRSGREIVEVRFDPKRLSMADLLKRARPCSNRAFVKAQHMDAARAVFGDRVEQGVQHRPSPKDDRYQLSHSSFARLPMTLLQAQRVNADLGRRRDPQRWLSPRQLKLVRAMTGQPQHAWPRPTGDLRSDMRRLSRVGS
ncbi:MAG: hypothetical protein AAFV29_19410, partial [Myxococcota bacterium]